MKKKYIITVILEDGTFDQQSPIKTYCFRAKGCLDLEKKVVNFLKDNFPYYTRIERFEYCKIYRRFFTEKSPHYVATTWVTRDKFNAILTNGVREAY